MRFLIRVWCNTCFDDPEGCFPGGSEIWHNGEGWAPFDSKELAEAAAHRRINGAPWDFEIIDADEARVTDSG